MMNKAHVTYACTVCRISNVEKRTWSYRPYCVSACLLEHSRPFPRWNASVPYYGHAMTQILPGVTLNLPKTDHQGYLPGGLESVLRL